jgi:hypothetical protein
MKWPLVYRSSYDRLAQERDEWRRITKQGWTDSDNWAWEIAVRSVRAQLRLMILDYNSEIVFNTEPSIIKARTYGFVANALAMFDPKRPIELEKRK